jgi:LacI family transcriptional regulator
MAARVGIREVAAAAEVAVGTVSHYLNHPDRVSAEKAARIQAAIDRLGFVRNNAGRQLRLGTSSAIAYIASAITNPYFAEIAESVEARAAERDVALFIANTHRDQAREDAYLDLFEEYQVRGILVASHEAIEDRLARLRRRGTPSVLVGYATAEDQPSISVDDVAGGRLAAQHLLEIGCERICYVGGPLGLRQVADRLSGAGDAVRRSSTATLEDIDVADRTLTAGREVGEHLVRRDAARRPDGIFAANDLIALGVLQALVLGGVRVPDDVAVIGYDDIVFGESSLIPLTTLRTSHQDFGYAAVDLLFDVMNGTAGEHRVVFTPELVARTSTARGLRA